MQAFRSLFASVVGALLIANPSQAALPAGARRSDPLFDSPMNVMNFFHVEREIGGMPSTFTQQLSATETRVELWHPMCFQKKVALLGTFCVAPTTEEADKDPNHLLPRLTFEVKREPDTPPVAVFLFDDEMSSWPAFWGGAIANKSCEELKPLAKAAVFEDPKKPANPNGPHIHSFVNVRGKMSHHWHLIAIDCASRQCPEVQSANVTFYHPNSDGSNDACRESGVGATIEELKTSMMGAMHAVSLRNVLHVVGLSAFGVLVLYAVFAVMLLFSILFLIWALRCDSSRRFLYLNTLFITTLSAMAYLALATGNGIVVLRKVVHQDLRPGQEDATYQVWRISDPMLAHKGTEKAPNPMYNEAYGMAPTYPILWARYVNQFLVTPLMLLNLFLVSGVSNNTRAFMIFSNMMCILCWGAGSFITGHSRWAFWLFGAIFAGGVVIPLIGVLPTAAAKKGNKARKLYGKLMCITVIVVVISPWVWVLVEGAHALPADLAVLVYGIMDVLSQCVLGMILLRKPPPALADWGHEPESGARLTPGTGTPGSQLGPQDDDL